MVVVHFFWVKNKLAQNWECHQLYYLLMVGETSESIFIGRVYSGHSGWPVQLCEFLLGLFGSRYSFGILVPRWGFRYYHYPHHSMECRWFLGAATRNLGGWFFITHGMAVRITREAGFLHPMILLWTSKKVTEQQQKVREMMVKVMR